MVYRPLIERSALERKYNGIPSVEDEKAIADFTYDVKLEPFERALKSEEPNLWLTSIRREQTALRSTLDIVIAEDVTLLKIAPLFYFLETDLKHYLTENRLPNTANYYDPTKQLANRECGLHQRSEPKSK